MEPKREQNVELGKQKRLVGKSTSKRNTVSRCCAIPISCRYTHDPSKIKTRKERLKTHQVSLDSSQRPTPGLTPHPFLHPASQKRKQNKRHKTRQVDQVFFFCRFRTTYRETINSDSSLPARHDRTKPNRIEPIRDMEHVKRTNHELYFKEPAKPNHGIDRLVENMQGARKEGNQQKHGDKKSIGRVHQLRGKTGRK